MKKVYKLTYEDVKKRFKDMGYVLLDEIYITNGTKMNIQDEYGYKYFVTPNSVKNEYVPEPFNKSNPHTVENIKLFFKKEGNGIIPIIDKYIGSKDTKIKHECETCGSMIEIRWCSVLKSKNFKCKKCNHDVIFKDIKYNLEYMKEEFTKYGYTITDTKYKGNNVPLKCVDKEGYKVKISYINLRSLKSPYRFSTKFNEENYIYNINNYFKNNDINCEALYYKKEEISYENYEVIVCKCDCGEEFETCWGSIKSGKIRCSKCVGEMSNLEKKVSEWLDYKNIKYVVQKTYDDLIHVRKLRFDFYIPDYNLCIEVDGIQHEIPVKFSKYIDEHESFKTIKFLDNLKNEYCKKNSIDLLRISHEDINRSENYIKILSNKLIKE